MLDTLRIAVSRRPTTKDLELATQRFREDGIVWFDNGLERDLVDRCHDAAMLRLQQCFERIEASGEGGLPMGTNSGYAEIVHRAPNRYDLLYGVDEPPFDDLAIRDDPRWMALVRALLGPDARLIYAGLLITLGGAGEQAWHADGDHLFGPEVNRLPPHCLNIFFPLVDLGKDNGPTEVCPGSHMFTAVLEGAYKQAPNMLERLAEITGAVLRAPVTLEVPAGSVIVFDYRLAHRALASRSQHARPMLYLTFARPWFQDIHNFPLRRLFPEGRNT